MWKVIYVDENKHRDFAGPYNQKILAIFRLITAQLAQPFVNYQIMRCDKCIGKK